MRLQILLPDPNLEMQVQTYQCLHYEWRRRRKWSAGSCAFQSGVILTHFSASLSRQIQKFNKLRWVSKREDKWTAFEVHFWVILNHPICFVAICDFDHLTTSAWCLTEYSPCEANWAAGGLCAGFHRLYFLFAYFIFRGINLHWCRGLYNKKPLLRLGLSVPQ